MGDNPVFAVMIAGCLASPLLSRVRGIIDENIGLDVYGRSSSGKTTIQTLATNLIYGLGDEIKSSWSKATLSGIWTHAEAINGLPLIMDDTHRIEEKLNGVPHDLVNGKEGNKSIKTTGEKWESKDTTSNRYNGVIMFNGEVGIASRSPKDSAGIFGRIIMIDHSPFPSSYDSFKVDNLKRESKFNGGHFIQPWLEHVSQFSITELNEQLTKQAVEFQDLAKNSLHGRLTMKAALLCWCIEQFSALFPVNIDVEAMKLLLRQSMGKETEHMSIPDQVMKEILTAVYNKIADKDDGVAEVIAIDWHGKTQPALDIGMEGDANIVYHRGKFIAIKADVMNEILHSYGRKDYRTILPQLLHEDYVTSADPTRFRRPKLVNETKIDPRMYGFKFPYENHGVLWSKITNETE